MTCEVKELEICEKKQQSRRRAGYDCSECIDCKRYEALKIKAEYEEKRLSLPRYLTNAGVIDLEYLIKTGFVTVIGEIGQRLPFYRSQCSDSLGTRICPICGEEFEVRNYRQIYCSRECQREKTRRCWRDYKYDGV